MSGLRAKLSRAIGSHSEDPVVSQEAGKYKLLITAGPSYDKSQHKVVYVNSGDAVFIENEFLRAKIKVRIREYRGLPDSCPRNSPYFDDPAHEKDQYSIAFSFVPKQDIPSVDTVWGNDYDHPIRDRLPPGVNTAFKIVKEFIDSGLAIDAYADEPWLYGPSVTSWFAFRIGEKVGDGEDFPAPEEGKAMEEGAEGSGIEVRKKLNLPSTYSTRHKHFLSAANREKLVFEKGRLYQADFYNPYIDFGHFSLKLPGFNLKVIKYVDQKSHCLRYVFKHRSNGDVYFNVNFNLLWGQQLEVAMKKDKEGRLDDGSNHQLAGLEIGAGPETGRDAKDQASVAVENTKPKSNGPAASNTTQSHPDDHSATSKQGTVNSITDLLRNTSTSDQTGARSQVFEDADVD